MEYGHEYKESSVYCNYESIENVKGFGSIILEDRNSKKLWKGDAVRRILGLSIETLENDDIPKSNIDNTLIKCEIFIKSESPNKILKKGDEFLFAKNL